MEEGCLHRQEKEVKDGKLQLMCARVNGKHAGQNDKWDH